MIRSCPNRLELKNQRLPGACNRSPGSKLLSITTQLHCGGHLGQLPTKMATKLKIEKRRMKLKKNLLLCNY
jgi:protein-arginine kinase activator protein McsA